MGPAIGDFAKALSWFLAAVTQGAANAWDRLTHRAPWEAEQIVKDDDSETYRRGAGRERRLSVGSSPVQLVDAGPQLHHERWAFVVAHGRSRLTRNACPPHLTSTDVW
jgi:hypothetical protein